MKLVRHSRWDINFHLWSEADRKQGHKVCFEREAETNISVKVAKFSYPLQAAKA